jgi:RNA polymerase sigma-70 factor, ECF subfamily
MAGGTAPEDVDETLLSRIARSDPDALGGLYDRYGSSVYSLAWGLVRDAQTAEEVTQDVFMGIWRNAQAFDAQLGTPRSWILSIAHHKSVDALRKQRGPAVVPLSDAILDRADVLSEALRSVEQARVHQALAALSADQRTAIVLAYYGGYTQREIAERLAIPLGTVKTRMRDGLLRLRAVLGPSAEETAP